MATAGYFVVGPPNATLSTTSTTAFNAKYAPGETIPIIVGFRTPTAGAENKRTIDVRVPSGAAAAGEVTFVFRAFAQNTLATLSTPVLPVAAATPLRTSRTGRLAFGGVTTVSLAFNLVTGLNEPAADAATGKDLQVNSLSSTGTLAVTTPNTTRYCELTSVQLAANLYATTTASTVGALLYQTSTPLAPTAAHPPWATCMP